MIKKAPGLCLEFSNKNPDHVINLTINQHEFHRFINEKKLEIMKRELNGVKDKLQSVSMKFSKVERNIRNMAAASSDEEYMLSILLGE